MPSLRFLHVEDDSFYFDLLRREFEGRGHKLIQLAMAEETVMVFNEEGYDAVIFDVFMDIHSGLAAWSDLRKSNPDVPWVILTNYKGTVGVTEDFENLAVPQEYVLQKSGPPADDVNAVLECLKSQGLNAK